MKIILNIIVTINLIYCTSTPTFAKEFNTHLESELFPNKESALQESRKMILEINAGQNKIAQSVAAKVCTLTNNARYKVTGIQIMSFPSLNKEKLAQTHYAAHIEYEIVCLTSTE